MVLVTVVAIAVKVGAVIYGNDSKSGGDGGDG